VVAVSFESWRSGIISDWKLKHLGEFTTVLENILGRETVA
jgi:hypothetical protein